MLPMVGKFAQGTVLTCCEKYQNTSDDICIFIDKESITESLTWYSWAASPDADESINHWITYLRFMGQLGQMVRNQSITESLNWDSWDSWPRWWVINQSLSLLPEIHGAAGPDGEALWVADPTCRTDPDKPNRYRWSSLREKCRLPILWHTPLKKKSCC